MCQGIDPFPDVKELPVMLTKTAVVVSFVVLDTAAGIFFGADSTKLVMSSKVIVECGNKSKG
jgi:hypothetical protein